MNGRGEEHQGPFAAGQERRRFSRVILERRARLFLGNNRYDMAMIRNLSIGGLFLEGQYPVDIDETGTLELHETGRNSSLILRFGARVVRTGNQGIALRFTHMEPDSYMFLQTMVLYATDDPYGVALEFMDDFPAVASRSC